MNEVIDAMFEKLVSILILLEFTRLQTIDLH